MRISLFGGGSDLPMYRELTGSGGCVLSCTIDRYVTVKPIVIYSAVLPGSGLGGSGALHVASTLAAHPYLTRPQLFDQAWQAETVMNRHAGWQDVAASTYGGLNLFTFDEELAVDPIALPPGLDARLLLFGTGITRKASAPLAMQAEQMSIHIPLLRELTVIAREAATALQRGNHSYAGALLHPAWLSKRLFSGVTNERINTAYDAARNAGATGGKLCGAGGGGFLLFYVEPDAQASVRAAMDDLGLRELAFNLTTDGATIVS